MKKTRGFTCNPESTKPSLFIVTFSSKPSLYNDFQFNKRFNKAVGDSTRQDKKTTDKIIRRTFVSS